MRRFTQAAFLAIALFGATGIALAAPPVKVTRFHLGTRIVPAPVALQSGADNDPNSLEQQQFVAAVANAFANLGFPGGDSATPAPLFATVNVTRTSRDETASRPPVTIGLGGGSFGRGGGAGIDLGFGVGKRPTRSFYITELAVQLRQRSDGAAIWEGRATIEVNARSKDAQPGLMAEKLAKALFQGFPGESGRTISVR